MFLLGPTIVFHSSPFWYYTLFFCSRLFSYWCLAVFLFLLLQSPTDIVCDWCANAAVEFDQIFQYLEQVRQAEVRELPDAMLLEVPAGSALVQGFLPKIFVRQSYLDLDALLLQPTTRPIAFLLGNRGIGKSSYLFWLMAKLLRQYPGVTVIYHHFRFNEYHYNVRRDVVTRVTLTIGSRNPALSGASNWYLVDGAVPVSAFCNARILLALSTGRQKKLAGDLRPLEDRSLPLELWMPVWEEKELVVCRRHIYPTVTPELMRVCMDRWGCIPRYVLQYAGAEDVQGTLDTAISQCNVDVLWKALRQQDTDPEAISFKLLHWKVENLKRTTLRFASDYVQNEVTAKLVMNHRDELAKFLRESAGAPLVASHRGYLMEQWSHGELCGGGSFSIRPLLDYGDPGLDTLVLPVSQPRYGHYFSSLPELADLPVGRYSIPRQRNFAALDSVMRVSDVDKRLGPTGQPVLCFFQMTVSGDHDIVGNTLKLVMEATHTSAAIVTYFFFVLPPDRYSQFKAQPYRAARRAEGHDHADPLIRVPPILQNVRQYALLMKAL